MRKKERPRATRRARARELVKEVRDRERLVALEPGGASERPREAASASVVEPLARSTPCHQCGGQLEVDEHAALAHEGELLRVVRATCRRCHARRTIWFRLAAPRAN